jgi:hypothetical protein
MDNIDATTAAAPAAAATASLNNTLRGGRARRGINIKIAILILGLIAMETRWSLQLLAYLSQYPHVRQAFYKPCVTFFPASVNLPGARFSVGVTA